MSSPIAPYPPSPVVCDVVIPQLPRGISHLHILQLDQLKLFRMAVIEEIDSEIPLSKEELAKLFEDEQNVVKAKSAKDIDAVNKFFDEDEDDELDEENENLDEEEVKASDAQFREGVNKEREKYQPTAMEKIFATMKSIILRALVFYVIMWFLKRNNANPGGAPPASTLDSSSPGLEEEEEGFEMPFGSKEDL